MSIVVNTNIGSLNAQRSLAESSRELATAMERLSSGKKNQQRCRRRSRVRHR